MTNIIDEEYFNDPFEDDWKAFTRSIRQDNAKSNRRLYKILAAIKGKSFVDSVKRLATGNGRLPQIRISRAPAGIRMRDNRWSAIPEIWVDQKQSEGGATGYIYVQAKDNRWLKIDY